jgi:isocitrate dehydrogenase
MPNLYGDVASDIAAEISGSVGLAGSANIGDQVAMFEAIHGSAPTIAGQGIANPSGLIRAAIMMLNHIGEQETAELIQHAWARTIEDGIHTPDIYVEGVSKEKVGTEAFANAVIARLGQKPQTLPAETYARGVEMKMPVYRRNKTRKKALKGVDIFVDWKGQEPDELAAKLQELNNEIKLTMITNRGVKVWPQGFEETFCTDHWRCRYEVKNGHPAEKMAIVDVLNRAIEKDIDVIKTENLYEFDGERGYSLGQGQ